MKNHFISWIVPVAVAFVSTTTAVQAQSSNQQERVQAAFVLSLGRAPSAAELAASSARTGVSVSDLMAHHREQLQRDSDLQRTINAKAYVDAFGLEPKGNESASQSGQTETYTELMKRHLKWLADHPADYEQVIERAYQRVMSRSAYPGEYAYWKQRPTSSYALLAGCIEEWGRRNSPGLMETTGAAAVSINSRFLTAIMLSPAIADEARTAIGLPIETDAPLATAAGQNLIGAGGSDIVTNGHMHLVVAGGPNLLPAPRGS